MQKNLFSPVIKLLGRRTAWRIGRLLYMHARADYPNNIASNGEEWLQSAILTSRQTKNKLVIFDVGANIGDWTLSLANVAILRKINTKLEIHAFEPVPETYSILKNRITRVSTGCDSLDIILQPLAASSRDEEAIIYLEGKTVGTNSLHSSSKTDNQLSTLKINCVTVDSYCLSKNITFIDLLKCDTEGHDFEVIKGAQKMMEMGNITLLQFEYNHRWIFSRHYLKDVFDLVKDLPYKVGKILPNKLEIYQSWHPELERFFEANFVLIHENILGEITNTVGGFDVSNTYSLYRHQ